MKKILIVGKNSYIGKSFANYVKDNVEFSIQFANSFDNKWKEIDFSEFDTVFHVAGIAHVSQKKSNDQIYYDVNRDLAIEVAKHAKASGVKQFIFMSSMIIYGKDGKVGKNKTIIKGDEFAPTNAYGKSKLEADLFIQTLEGNDFGVVIVRTPIVYGPNCKGNFPKLIKASKKLKIFPKINNQRSMIYIDNLSEFIKNVVQNQSKGIFYPQNTEYVCISQAVNQIALLNNNKIWNTKILNPFIYIASWFMPIINKVFGNKVYDKALSNDCDNSYNVVSFEESLLQLDKENKE